MFNQKTAPKYRPRLIRRRRFRLILTLRQAWLVFRKGIISNRMGTVIETSSNHFTFSLFVHFAKSNFHSVLPVCWQLSENLIYNHFHLKSWQIFSSYLISTSTRVINRFSILFFLFFLFLLERRFIFIDVNI